jgi:hypothetical protein
MDPRMISIMAGVEHQRQASWHWRRNPANYSRLTGRDWVDLLTWEVAHSWALNCAQAIAAYQEICALRAQMS